MVAARKQARLLLVLLLTGYLLAWIIFGVVALGIVWVMEQAPLNRLITHSWIYSVGAFFSGRYFSIFAIKICVSGYVPHTPWFFK